MPDGMQFVVGAGTICLSVFFGVRIGGFLWRNFPLWGPIAAVILGLFVFIVVLVTMRPTLDGFCHGAGYSGRSWWT